MLVRAYRCGALSRGAHHAALALSPALSRARLRLARDVEVHATGAELHEAEEALVAMRGRHAAREAQADEREQLLLQQAP